mmetsp:Transcript_18161/g.37807  ORF Transcript_18161/g.37807 Transcript_18161/m.37807 type:complete len:265 (+) Transcript_18161:246-1040(+)
MLPTALLDTEPSSSHVSSPPTVPDPGTLLPIDLSLSMSCLSLLALFLLAILTALTTLNQHCSTSSALLYSAAFSVLTGLIFILIVALLLFFVSSTFFLASLILTPPCILLAAWYFTPRSYSHSLLALMYLLYTLWIWKHAASSIALRIHSFSCTLSLSNLFTSSFSKALALMLSKNLCSTEAAFSIERASIRARMSPALRVRSFSRKDTRPFLPRHTRWIREAEELNFLKFFMEWTRSLARMYLPNDCTITVACAVLYLWNIPA